MLGYKNAPRANMLYRLFTLLSQRKSESIKGVDISRFVTYVQKYIDMTFVAPALAGSGILSKNYSTRSLNLVRGLRALTDLMKDSIDPLKPGVGFAYGGRTTDNSGTTNGSQESNEEAFNKLAGLNQRELEGSGCYMGDFIENYRKRSMNEVGNIMEPESLYDLWDDIEGRVKKNADQILESDSSIVLDAYDVAGAATALLWLYYSGFLQQIYGKVVRYDPSNRQTDPALYVGNPGGTTRTDKKKNLTGINLSYWEPWDYSDTDDDDTTDGSEPTESAKVGSAKICYRDMDQYIYHIKGQGVKGWDHIAQAALVGSRLCFVQHVWEALENELIAKGKIRFECVGNPAESFEIAKIQDLRIDSSRSGKFKVPGAEDIRVIQTPLITLKKKLAATSTMNKKNGFCSVAGVELKTGKSTWSHGPYSWDSKNQQFSTHFASTAPGDSGGLVLDIGSGTAIGLHVCGGDIANGFIPFDDAIVSFL
jgi:hypothetical protein